MYVQIFHVVSNINFKMDTVYRKANISIVILVNIEHIDTWHLYEYQCPCVYWHDAAQQVLRKPRPKTDITQLSQKIFHNIADWSCC